ncbi:MAG: alpha/beta hydrolase, partial [Gammaproteobacteria bacterium]
MLVGNFKKSLYLLYICLLVVGYGCTTAQNFTETIDSPNSADEIAVLQVKIDQLKNEIKRLNQRKAELKEIQKKSDSQNQALKIQVEQLEKRIDYLNNQKSEADVQKYQAEIARLNKQEQALTRRIAALNESLSDIYAEVVSSQASGNEPIAMAAEIKSSVSKLKSQLDKVKQERNGLKRDIDESRSQIEVLEAKSTNAKMGEQVIRSKSPLSLDVTEDNSPEIVEVFYGTNRARLVTTWGDILKPLFLPVVLLLMFFIIALVIRLVLKEHLQRPSILTVRLAIGAAFFYLIFTGIQSSVIKWQSKNTLSIQYGPHRISYEYGLPFELGVCKVSIPPTHEPGVVELPSLMYLELTVNPDKHFVMSDIKPQAEESFFENLNARIERSSDKDMFVFVHGFHNTFENAAFRTAQIAYDLNFSGAPVFFSWPSQGNVVDYPTDESNAGAAVQDLRVFLTQLI